MEPTPEPLTERGHPLALPAGRALSYQRSVLVPSGTSRVPDGWREVSTSAALGEGLDAFDATADDLLTLAAYGRAGIRIVEVDPAASSDIDILDGPLRGRCRLVARTDESLRQGVVVGTLEGHATVAEHRCHIDLHPDTGAVTATIRTTWRPSSAYLLPGAKGREIRAFRRMGERVVRALGAAGSGLGR